jgi:hypothetical protein
VIERAQKMGESMGLSVWNEDEAGPSQPMPSGSHRWQPEGHPAKQPHESIRNGTAKRLTFFHPSTGEVRVKGVTNCTNEVVHPWLTLELTAILSTFPEPPVVLSPQENRLVWERWREGLTIRVTLPAHFPPLRMLLIWDTLIGHTTPALWCWMFSHGILPLHMPLSGSWLNMAESIQRIMVRRALDGQYPPSSWQIIDWLEAVARHWNEHPTAFEWGGTRALRRTRAREQQQALAGSGACTRKPLRIRQTVLTKWQRAEQLTHSCSDHLHVKRTDVQSSCSITGEKRFSFIRASSVVHRQLIVIFD